MEKETRMLRRVLITSTVALALGAGVGGVFSQGAPGKVAMLLPGSINDQSWNAAGYAGLTKLKAMGIEIAYSENVQAADHIEAMKDYARRGLSPIIGHSGRFLSAAQRVGLEFEKTYFLGGSGSGRAQHVLRRRLGRRRRQERDLGGSRQRAVRLPRRRACRAHDENRQGRRRGGAR